LNTSSIFLISDREAQINLKEDQLMAKQIELERKAEHINKMLKSFTEPTTDMPFTAVVNTPPQIERCQDGLLMLHSED
jgi:hypothetical protein